MSKNKAPGEHPSVDQLADRKVQQTDEYWVAYERFKRIEPINGIAANRLTREEANERPRRPTHPTRLP